jgi:hypothetical protein
MLLIGIAANDPSEEVRAEDDETSAVMRERSHERFRRPARFSEIQVRVLDEMYVARAEAESRAAAAL